MAAQLYRQTMSYRISGGIADRVFTNEIGGPPFTLEPDDVMTLRFRCRRGIDWGANWTLEQITALVDSLERPIARARVKAVFRRGTRVVTRQQYVEVKTIKQQEYVNRLRALTANLTMRPNIPPSPFELE